MIQRVLSAAVLLLSVASIHAQVLVEPIKKKPKAEATPAATVTPAEPETPAKSETPEKTQAAASSEPSKVVAATATDEIKALAGKTATVEGKVVRIGTTSSGSITFINMAPGSSGFVAVVFKADSGKFSDGFDKYKGKTLRVTGEVKLFKETTPEIVVKSPEQIEIVADAAEAPKE